MRRPGKLVILLAAAGLLGGGWLVRGIIVRRSERIPQYVTTRVTRGTVMSSVDATGELKHGRQDYIYWEVTGTVTELLAGAGDTVHEGQLLARMDSQEARDRLVDARDNLEIARIRLAKAEEGYKTANQDAQLQYEKAKADLSTVLLRLEELEDGPGAMELETARSNLRAAERTCRAAEKEFALNKQLFAEGLVAKKEYDDSLQALAAARDQVTTARLRLEEITKPLDEKELARAEAAVKQAEINLLLAERNLETVETHRHDELTAARMEYRRQQRALAEAEELVESLELRAPFTGLILTINAAEGEEVVATSRGQETFLPFMILASHDRWEVQAYVNEEDVVKITLGMPAEIILLAKEDQVFSGRVSSVGAEARISSNIVTYPVIVQMEENAEFFRPGMSADLIIIIEQKEDVLILPQAAVTRRQGRSMAQVLRDGEIELIQVETGVAGNGMVEIRSGLENGDEVVTGIREPAGSTEQRRPDVRLNLPGIRIRG